MNKEHVINNPAYILLGPLPQGKSPGPSHVVQHQGRQVQVETVQKPKTSGLADDLQSDCSRKASVANSVVSVNTQQLPSDQIR